MAIEDFFERRAIHELHENIRQPVGFGNIVDGDDIGMGQDSGRLGLAKQALPQAAALGFVGEIGQADGFDGDNAADGGILSPVNDPCRTASELV